MVRFEPATHECVLRNCSTQVNASSRARSLSLATSVSPLNSTGNCNHTSMYFSCAHSSVFTRQGGEVCLKAAEWQGKQRFSWSATHWTRRHDKASLVNEGSSPKLSFATRQNVLRIYGVLCHLFSTIHLSPSWGFMFFLLVISLSIPFPSIDNEVWRVVLLILVDWICVVINEFSAL